MSDLPKIVIGIPGTWSSRSEIVTSIIARSGGYLFAGMVMVHIESKAACTVEIYDHDPQLRDAFEIAGGGKISDDDLIAIGEHTHTLYISADGGSVMAARALMRAANAMLQCGGAAIKVESAGVAHSRHKWSDLTENDFLPTSLLHAFVTYVGDDGSFYSCGMHNIGFRDAMVTANIHPDEAARLLHTFLLFIVCEDPVLHDGETFSVDETAPRYRITKALCTMFNANDLFHNPYGIWNLVPA